MYKTARNLSSVATKPGKAGMRLLKILAKALAAKGPDNKYETSSVGGPIADGTVVWRLSAVRH